MVQIKVINRDAEISPVGYDDLDTGLLSLHWVTISGPTKTTPRMVRGFTLHKSTRIRFSELERKKKIYCKFPNPDKVICNTFSHNVDHMYV